MKMRILGALCGIALAGSVWAQATKTEVKNRRVEDAVAATAKALDKRVGGLTEEQKAKITELYLNQEKEVARIQGGSSLSLKEKNERYAAIAKATQEALNTILTPEQVKKYRTLRPEDARTGTG